MSRTWSSDILYVQILPSPQNKVYSSKSPWRQMLFFFTTKNLEQLQAHEDPAICAGGK